MDRLEETVAELRDQLHRYTRCHPQHHRYRRRRRRDFGNDKIASGVYHGDDAINNAGIAMHHGDIGDNDSSDGIDIDGRSRGDRSSVSNGSGESVSYFSHGEEKEESRGEEDGDGDDDSNFSLAISKEGQEDRLGRQFKVLYGTRTVAFYCSPNFFLFDDFGHISSYRYTGLKLVVWRFRVLPTSTYYRKARLVAIFKVNARGRANETVFFTFFCTFYFMAKNLTLPHKRQKN